MKTLTLTKDEIKALQMVGYRYDCGSELLSDLIGDWQLQNPRKDYDEALEGFTVELYFDARRSLGDALKNDCENNVHPMLSREFTKKLFEAAYFDLEY